jgi:hypothetical protein
MLKERRSYERFSVEGEVVLKLENDASRIIKAELCGISFLGVSIYSPENIEPGLHVTLEVTIKLSDEVLVGGGKIAYSIGLAGNNAQSFQMGIEFADIENKKIQYFLNLIQHDIIEKARNKK